MAEPVSLVNSSNAALSGATAQTGGFAQAAVPNAENTAPPAAAFASAGFGGAGGLGTSPNVPKPGHSIDPATGKPFAAGLTRAELLAKREAGDRAPLADLGGREQAARQLVGTVEVNPLATQSQSADVVTPGQELPGGWGAVEPVPAPGTAPDAPTTIYEDVTTALNKVGQTAFNVIPQPVKEVLSAHPTDSTGQTVPQAPAGAVRGADAKPVEVPISPTVASASKALGTAPTSPAGRRFSIQAIVDAVKEQGKEIAHEIQDTYEHSPMGVAAKQRRASGTTGAENTVLGQVKGFVGNLIGAADHVTSVDPRTGLATMRVSMPSDEVAGALPGERSTGVGALPGKSTEAGVAVLPDEKHPKDTLPSQENQGMLPGENSGGVGALPGSSDETGVAVLPDERASGSGTSAAAGVGAAAAGGAAAGAVTIKNISAETAVVAKEPAPAPLVSELPDTAGTSKNISTETAVVAKEPAPAPLVSELPDTSDSLTAPATGAAYNANPHTAVAAKEPAPALLVSEQPAASSTTAAGGPALAPPLPDTMLGLGAAHGATAIQTTQSSAGIAPRAISREPSAQLLNESTAAALAIATGTESVPTMHGVDRSTSTASVTAIRGGHEGDLSDTKPSPLATMALPEEAAAPAQPVDRTPGSAADGIGHPSTRGPDTTRDVGSYPAAQHDGPADDAVAKANSHAIAPEQAAAAETEGGPLATDVPLEERAHPSGAAAAVVQDGKAHEANPNGWQSYKMSSPSTTTADESTASSGHARTSSSDSGKKKVGFMSKLKGEMKVISGKIANDDAKVAAGEKLKHGE